MVPVVLSVLVAAFVKGSIGFGFPTLGTPLLSLFVDVKTSILVLIVPNIVMDGVQFARRGAPLATVRRMATLVAFGAVGTVLGTRLLALLSSRTVMLILGGFILLFTAFGIARVSPRLPPRWEPWASPVAGFVAGRRWSSTSTRSGCPSTNSSAPSRSRSSSTRSSSWRR